MEYELLNSSHIQQQMNDQSNSAADPNRNKSSSLSTPAATPKTFKPASISRITQSHSSPFNKGTPPIATSLSLHTIGLNGRGYTLKAPASAREYNMTPSSSQRGLATGEATSAKERPKSAEMSNRRYSGSFNHEDVAPSFSNALARESRSTSPSNAHLSRNYEGEPLANLPIHDPVAQQTLEELRVRITDLSTENHALTRQLSGLYKNIADHEQSISVLTAQLNSAQQDAITKGKSTPIISVVNPDEVAANYEIIQQLAEAQTTGAKLRAELEALKLRITELQAQKDQLQNAANQANNESAQNTVELKYRAQQLEASRLMIEQLKADLKNARASHAEESETVDNVLQSQLDSLKIQLEESKTKATQLSISLEALQTANMDLANHQIQLQSDLGRSNSDLAQCKIQLADALERLTTANSTISELKAEREGFTSELHNHKEQLHSTNASHEHEKTRLETQISSLSSQLEGSAERHKSQLIQASSHLEELEVQLRSDIKTLSAQLEESKGKMTNKEREMESLQSELNLLKQESHNLDETQSLKDGQLTSLREELEESKNRVSKLSTELSSCKSSLSEALGTSEQLKSELISLQGKYEALQQEHNQTGLLLQLSNQNLASASEKLTSANEHLQSSQQSHISEYQHLKQELEDLTTQLQQYEHFIQSLKDELESSREACTQLKNEKDTLQSVIDSTNDGKSSSESQMKQLAEDLNEARSQLHSNSKELAACKTSLTEALESNDQLQSQLNSARDELVSKQHHHSKTAYELEQLQASHHSLSVEHTLVLSELEARSQQLREAEHQRAEGKEEISRQFGIIATLQAELDQTKAQLQFSQSDETKLKQQLENLCSELSVCKTKEQDLTQELEAIQTSSKQQRARHDEQLSGELSNANEEIQSVSSQLKEATEARESLKDKLEEANDHLATQSAKLEQLTADLNLSKAQILTDKVSASADLQQLAIQLRSLKEKISCQPDASSSLSHAPATVVTLTELIKGVNDAYLAKVSGDKTASTANQKGASAGLEAMAAESFPHSLAQQIAALPHSKDWFDHSLHLAFFLFIVAMLFGLFGSLFANFRLPARM